MVSLVVAANDTKNLPTVLSAAAAMSMDVSGFLQHAYFDLGNLYLNWYRTPS
jgi:hypothetical protein